MCKPWTRVISCFESVWMGFSEWLAIIHYSESRVVVKLGLITFGKKLFPGESEAEGLGGDGQSVFLWSVSEPGKC